MRAKILVVLMAVGMAGASAGGTSQTADPCAKVRQTNGWCKAGNVGYVAGLEVRSKLVFEALDVHGHPVEPTAMTCPTCRKAVAENGYCSDHNMGFVGGKAFLSRMTYELARSSRVDPASLHCPTCLEHTKGIGWCDRHQRGIAARFAWGDRQAFDDFEDAYHILQAALETAPTCETCAAAMVANGYCPKHRVKYDRGRPVAFPSP